MTNEVKSIKRTIIRDGYKAIMRIGNDFWFIVETGMQKIKCKVGTNTSLLRDLWENTV